MGVQVPCRVHAKAGGRRKYDKGAKEMMGVIIEMIEFWIATVRDKSEEMCHRMRASENIVWGFLGKPSQQVLAAHAHVDVSSELLKKDGPELDRLSDLWAAMIGAQTEEEFHRYSTLVDVTPSQSTSLASRSNGSMRGKLEATRAELERLAEEEEAEAEQRQARIMRSRPQPRLERRWRLR